MKLIILSLIFCGLTLSTSFAQSKRQIIDMEVAASEYFESNNYAEALGIYLKLDSINKKSSNYNYPIAISYLHLYKHHEALPYIEKCKGQKESYGPVLFYYIAKIYQLEYEFDSAISYYTKYKNAFEDHGKKSHQATLTTEHEIEMCEFAKQATQIENDVEIKNLSPVINSRYSEYGALLSGDEKTLIFTSERPNTTGGKFDTYDGTFYEDIYISHLTDTGWTTPESISDKINTGYHDASVALSHDGHKLIFYRYAPDGALHKSGDLYMSEFKNGEWSTPLHLDRNINSKGWEPSASFSLDDKELFFTSDRKGGYGGTDIYVIRQNKIGTWGKAENLGDSINTIYNDDAPYLHPDGKTFYFCSQGHQSMGGYDIFKTDYKHSSHSFSNVRNLGHPINTPDDDIDFTISANGKNIYFADDRPQGYGGKDIYIAHVSNIEKDLLQLNGTVKNNENEVIDTKIYVTGVNGSQTINRVSSTNMNLNGKYIILLNEGFKYTIRFESKDHESQIIELDTANLKGYKTETKNITLTKK